MFFSLFRAGKIKFNHGCPPLEKVLLATPWKNPLLSPGKNPSDGHDLGVLQTSR